MPSDTLAQRRYEQGYHERFRVLRSGELALVDALHAIAVAPNQGDYNRGANQATEDYIKELERGEPK